VPSARRKAGSIWSRKSISPLKAMSIFVYWTSNYNQVVIHG
jgi:hypothetical protein